jgi:MOSC domain-containing protein YiiM
LNLELYSVNVSRPHTIMYKGKEVATAIAKQAVSGPILLGQTQLEGDDQADKVHHGGEDKAICAYFHEHYTYWERVLGKPLSPGAFGENFTLRGGSERDVRIGDIFRLGNRIRLQVTQPRVPCFKLSAKHERPTLEREVADSGYTGFYLRVLELGEGEVHAGATLTLEAADPRGMTIEEANRIMHQDKEDLDSLRRLLAVEALAESWRAHLTKRLS